MMLDHLSIGVADLAASGAFYDAVLAPLGVRRLHDRPDMMGYGDTSADFWLNPAPRPVPRDAGNGCHISFRASDRASVDRFHAAGLTSGGTDNGAPGERPRYGPGYYAAFLIDPDGYRIEAHHQG